MTIILTSVLWFFSALMWLCRAYISLVGMILMVGTTIVLFIPILAIAAARTIYEDKAVVCNNIKRSVLAQAKSLGDALCDRL